MKEDVLISVRTNKDLADKFAKLCKDNGINRSEGLRRYIRYCVENNTLVFENELKIKKK